MLHLMYSCVMKSNYIGLAINMCLTIYLGIQMPNNTFSKWLLCECLSKPRETNEVPFFFQEVRMGMLIISIVFNLVRLIYEAIVQDISVILVAARLFLTILQVVDQWWFCKNWEPFFIEKKMRPYIWFRSFLTVTMFSCIFCVQKTFPPYTNNSSRLIFDVFQWVAGLQAMVWYYWGCHWKFTWGDMSDERRIRAISGTMFTASIIYGFMEVYLVSGIKTTSYQAAITAGMVGVIAFFLMGLGLRYLDIITKRSTQACRRILDESMVASMDHSEGILPTLPPPTRRRSQLMINIRRSIEIRRSSMDSQNDILVAEDIATAATGQRFGNNPGEENEEQGMEDNLTIPMDIIQEEQPEEMNDIESAFCNSNREENVFEIDRIRIQPLSNHNNNNNNSNDNILTRHSSSNLNVDEIGMIDRIRIKPITALTESSRSGGPLCGESSEHLMIDHVHVPMIRRNSLETNLNNYETAHLLSDKIVVVAVQVAQWYIFMMIIERCIQSYYEPEGYDDASGTIPVLKWCPVLSVFSGSTFASIQRLIDALF